MDRVGDCQPKLGGDAEPGASWPYAPPQAPGPVEPPHASEESRAHQLVRARKRFAGEASGLRILGAALLGSVGFMTLALVLGVPRLGTPGELAALGAWGLACTVSGAGLRRMRAWACAGAVGLTLAPLGLLLLAQLNSEPGRGAFVCAIVLAPLTFVHLVARMRGLSGPIATEVCEQAEPDAYLPFAFNTAVVPDFLIAFGILAMTYFTGALRVAYP